jgi:non-ribosomal peptide synthetase component E (peptide arylation enzyme)
LVAAQLPKNDVNQANLCRHLKHAAQNIPNALAVAVQKNRRGKLSYDEIDFAHLDQRSDNIAYALHAFGIKPGSKAVLMVTPSINFFALTLHFLKRVLFLFWLTRVWVLKTLSSVLLKRSLMLLLVYLKHI